MTNLNSATLARLRVGFNTAFQSGMAMADSASDRISTEIISTSGKETYGWVGSMPAVREWIGDRHVKSLEEHDYTLKNKSWESTVGVNRDAIEDDALAGMTPNFEMLGYQTVQHKERQVFSALQAGFTNDCYDGQPFFDTDHPNKDEDGNDVLVSNMQAGAGPFWCLMATKMPLKPIIFQKRRGWDQVALDRPDDPDVFNRKQLKYGVDSRSAVGYGYWQMAFGSKATLNAANYEAARTALINMKGDNGEVLGLIPDLLVHASTLESAALELIGVSTLSGGGQNKWHKTADLLMTPFLV